MYCIPCRGGNTCPGAGAAAQDPDQRAEYRQAAGALRAEPSAGRLARRVRQPLRTGLLRRRSAAFGAYWRRGRQRRRRRRMCPAGRVQCGTTWRRSHVVTVRLGAALARPYAYAGRARPDDDDAGVIAVTDAPTQTRSAPAGPSGGHQRPCGSRSPGRRCSGELPTTPPGCPVVAAAATCSFGGAGLCRIRGLSSMCANGPGYTWACSASSRRDRCKKVSIRPAPGQRFDSRSAGCTVAARARRDAAHPARAMHPRVIASPR